MESSKEPNTAVVVCSTRRATTLKAVQTLPQLNGLECGDYKEISGQIDLRVQRNVVVQYESLSRVVGFDDPNLNVIFVLDEFNSICHQMQSEYGAPNPAQQTFIQLIAKSVNVIAMDGCLDQDRVDIFEKYAGQKIHLIHNKFKSRRNNTYRQTYDVVGTRRFVMDCLAMHEPVISPCLSKGFAEKLYQEVVARFGDSRVALLFTRDAPWDGTDVNDSWKTADLVIHTSTIDTGISFEVLKHFMHCVAFLNNHTGPTHETALQMLSRSRDTRNFLLCITVTPPAFLSTDKDAILEERGELNAASDLQFFGILHAHEHSRSKDWATCNAYLSTKIMSKVIKRRAENDMVGALLDLLQQDGARITTRYTFPSVQSIAPAIADVKPDSVPIPGANLEKKSNSLKVVYNYSGFTVDDEAALKLYEKPAKIAAYRNLSMLTRLGTNFNEALEQKERDIAMIQAEIAKAAATGAFDPCIISRTEVSVGLEDGLYDLNVNRLASTLCKMVTGECDPFALVQMQEEDISARLGCSVMQVAVTKKDALAYEEQLCLSQEKKEEFLGVFDRWTRLKPELHATQLLRRRTGPLSLVKAVHALNHVLTITYDMGFSRDTGLKWKGKKRICTYSQRESTDFPRLASDLTGDKSKPYLPPWPSRPPGDLTARDLLEVNFAKGLIQAGFGFLKRQSVDTCMKSLPREEQLDIDRAQKRQKTSHLTG